MDASHHVLILGATGRTGGRVLTQLLDRGVAARAIVRSAARLPASAVDNPLLDVVEADLLELPVERLAQHLADCDAVISCLGHPINVKGVFRPPRDLAERAIRTVRTAADSLAPEVPLRLILMSSVSVNRPDRADTRRGAGERAVLWGLRGLVPPSRDNQRAADFLLHEMGLADRHLEWVTVRPDSLTEGEVSEYRIQEELVAGLFRPDHTRMANVAHFMCELATDATAWQRWRGRLPVIVDADPAPG